MISDCLVMLAENYSIPLPIMLWHHNGPMEIVNFPEQHFQSVAASGDCPHCPVRSYFRPVGRAHVEQVREAREWRIANAGQCESCKKFVLIVGQHPGGGQQAPW